MVSHCLLTTLVKVFCSLFLCMFHFNFFLCSTSSNHLCKHLSQRNDTYFWLAPCVVGYTVEKFSLFFVCLAWTKQKQQQQWSRAKTYLKCISASLPSNTLIYDFPVKLQHNATTDTKLSQNNCQKSYYMQFAMLIGNVLALLWLITDFCMNAPT